MLHSNYCKLKVFLVLIIDNWAYSSFENRLREEGRSDLEENDSSSLSKKEDSGKEGNFKKFVGFFFEFMLAKSFWF